MSATTLLEKVRTRLVTLKGEDLRKLATAAAMSYDTALRIRDGKTDPPFSQVQKLAEQLKVVR